MKGVSWIRTAEHYAAQKAAVVLSVQHTGTWFTISFVQGYPQVGQLSELRDVYGFPVVHRALIHAHILGEGEPHTADKAKFIGREGVRALCQLCRVIIPIRDPLKALLSRSARHPLLDHSYLVDAFALVAEESMGATYLPIDSPGDRTGLLHRVRLALDLEALHDYEKAYAEKWLPRNTSHLTAAKQAYEDGNIHEVRKYIGPELEMLLERRDVIVPFLKNVGYKELPWWNL